MGSHHYPFFSFFSFFGSVLFEGKRMIFMGFAFLVLVDKDAEKGEHLLVLLHYEGVGEVRRGSALNKEN
jgi:hypothetical protein